MLLSQPAGGYFPATAIATREPAQRILVEARVAVAARCNWLCVAVRSMRGNSFRAGVGVDYSTMLSCPLRPCMFLGLHLSHASARTGFLRWGDVVPRLVAGARVLYAFA